MGYNTYFDGEIRIEPPLTNAELADCPFIRTRDDFGYEPAIKVRVQEQTEETPEGTLTRRTGVAIVPAWEDEAFKGYDFEQNMHKFVATYGTAPDGHPREFTGHISGDGEDSHDLWVCKVVDGRVVKAKAAIVWPDDLNPVNAKVADVRALLARRVGGDPGAVTMDELHEATAALCVAVAEFADRFEITEV